MSRIKVKRDWLVRRLDTRARDDRHPPALAHGDSIPPLQRKSGIQDAAVLVAVVQNPRQSTVLLTRRAAHLSHHPGQISLPGGRLEYGETPREAALREAREETGLNPHAVEILGTLEPYITGTGFSVTPIVAMVNGPLSPRADPSEVAEIFEVPFAFLMDPANHKRHETRIRGINRRYHAIPYGPYYIWGATAAILINLYRRLA